jgi:hypothetical protein
MMDEKGKQEGFLEQLRAVLNESRDTQVVTKDDLSTLESRLVMHIENSEARQNEAIVSAEKRIRSEIKATEDRLMNEIHLVRDDIRKINNRVHTLEEAA